MVLVFYDARQMKRNKKNSFAVVWAHKTKIVRVANAAIGVYMI